MIIIITDVVVVFVVVDDLFVQTVALRSFTHTLYTRLSQQKTNSRYIFNWKHLK